MALRTSVSWRQFILRLMPSIGYHDIIMILLAISIALLSVLLAGCSNSGLTGIYLLSLTYPSDVKSPKNSSLQLNPDFSSVFTSAVDSMAKTGTTLEIRIGYMGMCMKETSALWVCSRSASALANTVRESKSAAGDPLNLIWLANTFRSQVFFSGLLFTSIPLIFIAIILLLSFPRWHTEVDDDNSERGVKPFPIMYVLQAALAILVVASLLVFVSVFWQHISSSAVAVTAGGLSYGSIRGHIGTGAIVLGWASVVLVTMAAISLLVMILSIRAMASLFD